MRLSLHLLVTTIVLTSVPRPHPCSSHIVRIFEDKHYSTHISLVVPLDTADVPTPAPAPAPTDAQAPFNKPSADLVLRSSDNVIFRVRKAILAEASPVFEDMFTLPVRQDPSPNDPTLVVHMAEDSRVLDGLLRLCYPISETQIRTLDEAIILLEPAKKYCMDSTLAYLGERLMVFVEAQPVRVYALAIRYQLSEEVVRAAAKAFLKISFSSSEAKSLKDLDHISASAYARLLDYRDRCSAAAMRSVDDYSWIAAGRWCWLECPTSEQQCAVSSQCVVIAGATVRPRLWWTNLMAFCRATLQQHPCASILNTNRAGTALALVQAGKCYSLCGMNAARDVQRFMDLLIKRIDKAVSAVSSCGVYRNAP